MIKLEATEVQFSRGASPGAEIDEFELAAPSPYDKLLAVDEVLGAFSVQYRVQAEVKLRYFVGMTNEKASQATSPKAGAIYQPRAKRFTEQRAG
jgi:hypothetical protein